VARQYASADIEPEEVAAIVIALYHALTLQWHTDPGVIRPDLIMRVLRAIADPENGSQVDATRHQRTA